MREDIIKNVYLRVNIDSEVVDWMGTAIEPL